MTTKQKNTSTRLIRKSARGFRQGEWIFLFGCTEARPADRFEPDTDRLLHGPFLIEEVKHHTDITVTFLARPIRLVPHGQTYNGVTDKVVMELPHATMVATTGLTWLEFKRDYQLHRIAGIPLQTIIQEIEEVPL